MLPSDKNGAPDVPKSVPVTTMACELPSAASRRGDDAPADAEDDPREMRVNIGALTLYTEAVPPACTQEAEERPRLCQL